MPTPTYDLISSTTLVAPTAHLTFTSLTQSYRDLIFVISGASTANVTMWVRYNNDTGANYSRTGMSGNGSTPAGFAATDETLTYLVLWRTTQGTVTHQIFDYSATDKHKTSLTRGDVQESETVAIAHRWASTSAVTTVTFSVADFSFTAGTTAALYGVIA